MYILRRPSRYQRRSAANLRHHGKFERNSRRTSCSCVFASFFHDPESCGSDHRSYQLPKSDFHCIFLRRSLSSRFRDFPTGIFHRLPIPRRSRRIHGRSCHCHRTAAIEGVTWNHSLHKQYWCRLCYESCLGSYSPTCMNEHTFRVLIKTINSDHRCLFVWQLRPYNFVLGCSFLIFILVCRFIVRN